jgi:hypothetical protein
MSSCAEMSSWAQKREKVTWFDSVQFFFFKWVDMAIKKL